MEKIAYIIDSSCFLNEKQVKDLGFIFIPLHCIVENEDFLEGRNLDHEYLKEAIKAKKNVSTSQPSPGEIIELVNNLKKEGYTCGVFSSMGSALSKTFENVIATAGLENFSIYGIDSCSVGQVQVMPLLKVKKLIEQENYAIEDAIAVVKQDINNSMTLLMVDDLFHLSRGGRITSTAAAFGSMFKIKPLLSLVVEKHGQIDVIEKIRTAKKATKKMAAIALENRDMSKYKIIVAHFYGKELASELKEELLKLNSSLEIDILEITTVIGVHTGLNCVGVQVCPK